MENELELLAIKYGTDKQKSNHNYTEYYYRHFNSFRYESMNVLEIGVHKGYSLNMWADYFVNSKIFGIDDGSSGDLETNYSNTRINFRKGSQIDNTFLASLIQEVGQFDLIIDDGSHYSSDIIHSLGFLFDNYLKKGGYYVVEDLQCSYPPYTAPGLAPRFNSNGFTAVELLKLAIDNLNYNPERNITELHFYPQICFLKK